MPQIVAETSIFPKVFLSLLPSPGNFNVHPVAQRKAVLVGMLVGFRLVAAVAGKVFHCVFARPFRRGCGILAVILSGAGR